MILKHNKIFYEFLSCIMNVIGNNISIYYDLVSPNSIADNSVPTNIIHLFVSRTQHFSFDVKDLMRWVRPTVGVVTHRLSCTQQLAW